MVLVLAIGMASTSIAGFLVGGVMLGGYSPAAPMHQVKTTVLRFCGIHP
jgi:hypothetical protein